MTRIRAYLVINCNGELYYTFVNLIWKVIDSQNQNGTFKKRTNRISTWLLVIQFTATESLNLLPFCRNDSKNLFQGVRTLLASSSFNIQGYSFTFAPLSNFHEKM